MVADDANFHKAFFAGLSPEEISDKKLRESVERVREKGGLYEKVLAKRDYSVVLLGPNENPGQPSGLMLELREAIQKESFPCNLGTSYYNTLEGFFEDDIQGEIMNSNALAILINSANTGVIDESKAVRMRDDWKRKTLFFFKYADYDSLVSMARNKRYPVYFKFPIPYRGEAELKAKILFGIHHCYLYNVRKKYRNQTGNNGKKIKEEK